MARWQRDPKLRRRALILLAAGEMLALGVCFFGIFQAYLYRMMLRLGVADPPASGLILVMAATVLWAAAAVFVAVMYVKGRRWARGALIAANSVLVALGLLWFVIHFTRAGGDVRDTTASLVGLLLPMVTLFPLLWPLLTFRQDGPGQGPGARANR